MPSRAGQAALDEIEAGPGRLLPQPRRGADHRRAGRRPRSFCCSTDRDERDRDRDPASDRRYVPALRFSVLPASVVARSQIELGRRWQSAITSSKARTIQSSSDCETHSGGSSLMTYIS